MDKELIALRRQRAELAEAVNAGSIEPAAALAELHKTVDAYNRHYQFVRHWGRL